MRTRILLVAGLAVLLAACTPSEDPQDQHPPRLPASLSEFFPSPSPPPPPGDWLSTSCTAPLEHLQRVRRGAFPGRSYDVFFVPRYPNSIGTFDGYTTHGGPWDYLQRVPLVFAGPGYIRPTGEISVDREVTVADVAPTLAELLGVEAPNDGPGRVIEEVLVPENLRAEPPRLVVTMVWDGGGSDVLEAWPDSWPRLADLIADGSSIRGATIGSAPSTTPPVHATIGTGVWPSDHGIVDLTQRRGNKVKDSYINKEEDFDPIQLEVPTLADVFDPALGNEPQVGLIGYRGWHLGMMSHGSRTAGGDEDIAAIIDRDGGPLTDAGPWYDLPSYMRDVEGLEADTRTADLADGKVDGRWRSVDLDDPVTLQYSPAYTLYQTRLLKTLVTEGGFGGDSVTDLLFVNYKQIDDVGHFYNMLSPEMEEIVRYTDRALADVLDLLDRRVGRGNWVLVLTADHGETPDLRSIRGWPIDQEILKQVVAERFGVEPADLFLQARTMGFWLDEEFRNDHGITLEEVADVLIDLRARDMLAEGESVPEMYSDRLDEPLFEAAFPGDRLDDVWRCAAGRSE
ncbi:MAG: alkaline phosphatase family protein [Actinomycetota bacterium]|nr:alkaline phosphatase family protein [Actinomycetota bacterium]